MKHVPKGPLKKPARDRDPRTRERLEECQLQANKAHRMEQPSVAKNRGTVSDVPQMWRGICRMGAILEVQNVTACVSGRIFFEKA